MQPEVIASRYEVIEQISDSNMAVVYRAFDRRDQKLVAIKRLKLPTTEKESRTRLIEHFRQEAQILEQFKDHPHVVDLIDFNEEDGDPYIVMEYVGNSLRKMINSSAGQLPTSLVVSIAYDLARMLQEAHEAKIIHCDIKPSNVLVTDMGLAKLADFGVAFLPNQLGRGIVHDGVAFGTPLYWPPEASSKAIRPNSQTDVWAFGVMLYEMLTGDHPIPGLPAGSDQDVTNLIRRHDIIPIQQKRRDIPEGLVSLITEMLDKNKSRRINNFETVSRRLRNIYRNHTQHNLPTYDHPSEAHTQSLGMRSLLKEMVRQGSKNENKEWVRFVLATLIGVIAIGISMREVQLQADANEQLQATIIFLSQSTDEPVATLTASPPEVTAVSTASSVPASQTPEPTLTSTDEPTRTTTPSPSPSPSPSATPPPSATSSLTPTIMPSPTASATAIRLSQDISSLPCQTSVEDGEPYALLYAQPSLGLSPIDRLWKGDSAPVHETLPGWIGIEIQSKYAYARDEQVQTYGDCDDLFLNRIQQTTTEASSTPSLTPTASPEPTPTPTRPRPPRPSATPIPTDVPTVIYVPPPITQNPPADVTQPAEPAIQPQPPATNTSIPPTVAPQPTDQPIPTNTSIPPTQEPAPTAAPNPTTPSIPPTDEPTATRGPVFPLG